MNNKEIIKKFTDACNLLASGVNEQLFDNGRKWYWVADIMGGTCDFENGDFLSSEDMILILDNNITYEQYSKWKWMNIDNSDTICYINLKSWLMGARHNMIKPKLQYGVWISVKDELPPYDESVLCCNIADPEDMFWCHRSNNPNVQVDSNGWCHYEEGNITHWMRVESINTNSQK